MRHTHTRKLWRQTVSVRLGRRSPPQPHHEARCRSTARHIRRRTQQHNNRSHETARRIFCRLSQRVQPAAAPRGHSVSDSSMGRTAAHTLRHYRFLRRTGTAHGTSRCRTRRSGSQRSQCAVNSHSVPPCGGRKRLFDGLCRRHRRQTIPAETRG